MTEGDTGAPELVLGPLLRYVGETEATIWVETERACEVEILGHQARTFEVAGHHYALVVIGDLSPGTEHEYQVALDGAVRWPEPDSEFPPSVLRTPDPGRPLRLAFGSCRIAELPDPAAPAQLPPHAAGRGGTRPGRDGRLRPGPARDAARAVARPDAAGSATRSTPTTRGRPRATSSSSTATRPNRLAIRSRTSASTASCTGRPGPSPRCAGCCPSSPPR